ncbi:hypothetical protein B0H67DRAFT_45680 [Lasiosphaeris hirsuta]|uniref:HMG box domain-containing protein n=1 Tax=Lasiosphaeris hirsuta TaxID=260670 RepID=A0AA40BAF2_9PEZI|nr:hypothetical protein B0H67DRAFT_45680 [Lasiosphaeris hirsuta]
MWPAIGLTAAARQLRLTGGARFASLRTTITTRSVIVLRRGFSVTYTRSDPAETPVASKPKNVGRPKGSTTVKKPKIKTKRTPSKDKVVAKKKTAVRKKLAPKQKAAQTVRDLKKAALLYEAPSVKPSTPWMVYTSEHKDKFQNLPPGATNDVVTSHFTSVIRQLSQSFKTITSSELERLQAVAIQNKVANTASMKAWVLAHTPAEIAAANKARSALRLQDGRLKPHTLKDDRLLRRPASPYALFVKSRWQSGEIERKGFLAGSKEIAIQWKALTDAERKLYTDLAETKKAEFTAEHEV